jgi:undecaprenyl-diphosphatase
MDQIYIFCARYLVLLLILGAFVLWLRLSKAAKLHMVIFGLVTAEVAYLLSLIGSQLYFDPRPFVDGHVHALIKHGFDNGFPSDHTLLAAVVAATVYTVSRRWGVVFLAGAVAVGLGRVLVHVHHLIDILGSFVLTGLAAVVAWYLTPKIIVYITKRNS